MKRMLVAGAALLALAGFGAGPAYADGDVYVTTFLGKEINQYELFYNDTEVLVLAEVNVNATEVANSSAILNQRNEYNFACENCAEKESIIVDSASRNVGMVSVNQATGNMNAQGTLISAAVDTEQEPPGTDERYGFAEATASAEQINQYNNTFATGILYRDASIDNSFNGNDGLAYGNQAVGSMANQTNVLAAAFSLADSGVAMSDAQLGQANADNHVTEYGTVHRSSSISGSINNNTGIVGVNQSSGNMANQANIVAIAAIGVGF